MTRVYLCGSVKKGRDDVRPSTEFWTEIEEDLLRASLPEPLKLLNPSKTKIARNDFFVNFGCDIFLVKSADLLIADLRTEKGIGVGAELMFARQSGIPVIAWLPPNTHYRRNLKDVFGEDLRDWIHPFAYSLSDYIEDSLENVCERARALLAGLTPRTAKDRAIPEAIGRFLSAYPEYAID